MVKIAIAGGTSQPSATPSSTATPTTLYGAEVRHIDYTSAPSLTSALADIHTLISVLKLPGPAMATTQINLLNAAKVSGVRRFAPSEFGLGACERVDATAAKERVWRACLASGSRSRASAAARS
ncbi:NmrA-like protein [Botryosphaeria dothidea]|uniref:NmrA-like protein n=1 Tax=Botryosphaeria dothidea TaxID=55169 RepID=A0A8H4IW03_9PEZI|nr:NmrA-like protein [Botryosphaeria dothidea]